MQNICIYSIRQFGGLIAGDPLWYELWLPGSIMTVKDKETVSLISSAIAYANKHKHEVCNYVSWILNEGE